MTDAGKSRAAVLRDELEARGDKPPERTRTWLTYIDRPGEVVEVPLTIPADIVAAEEVLGKGDKPFVQLSFYAQTQGWLAWRALRRHPEERERPDAEFSVWFETVDQIWDEEKKPDPLAEPASPASPRLVSTGNSLPTQD